MSLLLELAQQYGTGALYSVGATPIDVVGKGAGGGYGPNAFIGKSPGGKALDYWNWGTGQLGFNVETGRLGVTGYGADEITNLYSQHPKGGVGGAVGAGGIRQGSWLAPVAGLGITGYMALDAYSQDGMAGVRDYLVQDFAAHGALAKEVYQYKDTGRADAQFQRRHSGLFGGGRSFIGNFGFMAGAGMTSFAGSMAGFSLGSSLGTGASNLLLGGSGEGALGFTGGVLGAAVGAKVGAKLGGSLFRNLFSFGGAARAALAIGVGTVIGGAYTTAKGSFDILSTGYRKRMEGSRVGTAGSMASFMTQNAVTMRQRSVQAMHKSHLNARSALGQEATFMNFNRDYFSTYRSM